MIKIDNIDVTGFEAAIRGMRNPFNSWDKSDSGYRHYSNVTHTDMGLNPYQQDIDDEFEVGSNDLKLMQSLIRAGTDHSKFMRMINVTMDVTAPLYLWKEWDTYKVGTVANSCSTMHKLHSKKFTLDDFSHEHLDGYSLDILDNIIDRLNDNRKHFIETQDKIYWWQMIQLLPTSYNQKRTIQLNYQVLRNIYFARKNHKLDEWQEFCKTVEKLPYGKELITIDVD